jgi:hypothetical protein
MKTEDLIRTLAAAGNAPRPALSNLLLGAGIIGFAIATLAFMSLLHPRGDLMDAAQHFNFRLKFVVTLSLALGAAGLFWRVLHPGARAGIWRAAMVVAPIVVLAGVMHEMMVAPAGTLMAGMVGRNNMTCVLSIPLLSLPILAGLIYVSRHGAPERPALAGALAGILSAALAATLYATHCTDDSPLFVITWYSIAIALMAAIGALAGSRFLRW